MDDREIRMKCIELASELETLVVTAAENVVAAGSELFRKAGVCHFACHGKFVPDQPDASGMVLIPDAQRPEILSLRDLSQLELANCQHVTLSSCWSADNFILPGRWIVSLPETLYRSGAQSILGCIWPVHDRVAECFMARFYIHLAELSRVEALRRTQLECRAGALPGCDVDTRHLFHWAGFSLFGDAVSDRLRLNGGRSHSFFFRRRLCSAL